MYRKTMTYMDFDGVERKDTFYFNLTKAELIDMELTTTGGYAAYMEKIIDTKDTKELIVLFKDLVDRSYGEKSADGRKFVKTPELLADFKCSAAYSDFYMELVSDTDAAIAFVNGIMPQLNAEEKRQVDAQVAAKREELGL